MANSETRIDKETGAALAARESPGNINPSDIFHNFSSRFAPMWATGDVDVSRTENGYSVDLPVAGFAPDQIDVTYQDGALTISGKSNRRSFARTLVLPEEIDPDKTTARVEHGLLTIDVSLRPEAKPKKIKIDVRK